jgi:hypothetical protein
MIFYREMWELGDFMSRVSMDSALVGDKTWECVGVVLAYGGRWLRSEAVSRGF